VARILQHEIRRHQRKHDEPAELIQIDLLFSVTPEGTQVPKTSPVKIVKVKR
jgi:hypothetical protein